MSVKHLDTKQNMIGTDSRVGSLIRARRLRCDLSLQELAARAGCTKGYLSAVENGLRRAPGESVLRAIEEAMGMEPGSLVRAGLLERALDAGGEPFREELTRLKKNDGLVRDLVRAFKGSASEQERVRALRQIVGNIDPPAPGGPVPIPLPSEVPLINSVAAGYPRSFTDLSYPARVADEYVRCPDLNDPDAFAARVVGDSMQPDYAEGDIVVFSPALPVRSGMDCFARLEPDHETTFKRVYFEPGPGGGEVIRLQPLNPAYPPRSYPREQIAGLYAAVSIMKRIRPPGV